MDRKEALEEAEKIVCDGREEDYGGPEQSFQRIADYWSTYLEIEIKPYQVAAMMAMLKLARLQTNPKHKDSIIDAIGYFSCYADCLEKEPAEMDCE